MDHVEIAEIFVYPENSVCWHLFFIDVVMLIISKLIIIYTNNLIEKPQILNNIF